MYALAMTENFYKFSRLCLVLDELDELGEGDKWMKPHVAQGRFAPEGRHRADKKG